MEKVFLERIKKKLYVEVYFDFSNNFPTQQRV